MINRKILGLVGAIIVVLVGGWILISTRDERAEVDLGFSDARLEEMMDNGARNELIDVIFTTYPVEMVGFEVRGMRLFGRGEWAGVVLETKKGQEDGTEITYGVVVKKTDGGWEIVGRPELVVTVYTHPEVPVEVLRMVNELMLY